ncbi:hypothetical protein GCK72_019068 [Caenorhabditis remanei]|uniref:Uncharacterized protein n=1 Tax=Caenorhabditis remanei TaxID=31234 RepID=A0A6A5GCW2_CAERE|nr:hypothetical protein GCK72_019068 [Caenorhabditis remanei]KAF1752513.1 hypothetical protein GCK72_019068 [Caenorhabditis remanei]
MPHGLVVSVIYVVLHMIVWGSIDYFCLHSAPDMRNYIRASFKELYNENIDNINFVAGMFSDTSDEIILRSWAGIISLTGIGLYSIVLYFVLGYKIVSGLNSEFVMMSKKTAQMQKQLFKALAIQTVIPICVSFIPCSFTFYGAALRIDIKNWIYWISAIAISMFPCLDPLAIIFFLPALRQHLLKPFCKGRHLISAVTNQYSL